MVESTRSPRRSPGTAERRRDPERSRERILAAALEEFGAKGYAGARVSEIAARAGVNKQLISYYFGGKEGLYRQLAGQWQADEASLASPEVPLPEMVANYARTSVTHRSWARLLLWQALTDADGPGDAAADGDERSGGPAAVEDLRRRQREGELPADIDPGCLLLAMSAAAMATVSWPALAREVSGGDPDSEEFTAYYADQLARIVGYLTRTPSTRD